MFIPAAKTGSKGVTKSEQVQSGPRSSTTILALHRKIQQRLKVSVGTRGYRVLVVRPPPHRSALHRLVLLSPRLNLSSRRVIDRQQLL